MSDFDHTIVHNPQVRHADGKVFTSPHAQAHNGKRCKRLRMLTPEDAEFKEHWRVDVAQAVVELEDGSHAVVLHDEAVA